MYAKLTVVRGTKRPQELKLRLPTVIGRGSSAALKLPSSTVSRQHCEIYAYENEIAIRDLGSSNGTLVNGHRIEGPTFITAEDEVVIGPLAFQLSVLSESAASPVETAHDSMQSVADDRDAEDAAREVATSPAAKESTKATSGATTEPEQPDAEVAEVVAPESADVDDALPKVDAETPAGTEATEDSVLRYVEPETDDDPSFVRIDVEENPGQSPASKIVDPPDFEVDSTSNNTKVAGDDSSLTDFLRNMD